MGKCIVTMSKVTKSGLSGIQIHMNREHQSKTNPDIDYNKTKDNYSIIATENLNREIKQTINDYLYSKKAIRKDAIHLCTFLITASPESIKEMGLEKAKNYFADSVEFFKNRYGSEFIKYATVHLDESNPHLHIGVVPAVMCRDTDDMKLSAKEKFNAKELRSLQTDFYVLVGRKYGLERGEENSKAKHKSEIDYKLEKQAEKLAQIEKQIYDLTQLKNDLQAICDSLEHKATSKGFTMSDYKERIQEIRQQQAVEQRATLLEQFISHPKIAPLWQAFVTSRQHNRASDKER